ncbi:MAG: hypothetical protein EAZ80_13495 [Runella slithyformis]|nr:MAG: hypothetical protein EAZ80_13495 [Runella slithyformis]
MLSPLKSAAILTLKSTLAVAPGKIGPAIGTFKRTVWPLTTSQFVSLAAKLMPTGNKSVKATCVAVMLPSFLTVKVNFTVPPGNTLAL